MIGKGYITYDKTTTQISQYDNDSCAADSQPFLWCLSL